MHAMHCHAMEGTDHNCNLLCKTCDLIACIVHNVGAQHMACKTHHRLQSEDLSCVCNGLLGEEGAALAGGDCHVCIAPNDQGGAIVTTAEFEAPHKDNFTDGKRHICPLIYHLRLLCWRSETCEVQQCLCTLRAAVATFVQLNAMYASNDIAVHCPRI
jgi:hypothetical protein